MPALVFVTTPKIICSQGGSHRLGEIAAGLGMRRVFVVTDKGLMQAGLLAPALASLQGAGIPPKSGCLFQPAVAWDDGFCCRSTKIQREYE